MSVVTRAASKLKFETGDAPSQADFIDLHDSIVFAGEEDIVLSALQGLGSSIKMQTVGAKSPSWITVALGIGSGDQHLTVMTYLRLPQTLTGVRFYQIVQGVFTGNNVNSIALYSYSGGNITKVAESANDANIWKGSANTWQTVPFSATYDAAAGVYVVGLVYSTSAQTTQPQIGGLANSYNGAVQSFDLTNSAKLHSFIGGRTTQATPIAMSSLSTNTARIYLTVY